MKSVKPTCASRWSSPASTSRCPPDELQPDAPRRRPGAPDTRSAILAAARAAFADKGFAGTTIRGVAAAAGVDPALVHHYFGTKDDLFVAALELPVDPRQVIAPVVAGGVDGAGERLLRAFLTVWDDPEVAAGAGRLRPLGAAAGRRAPGDAGASCRWCSRRSARPSGSTGPRSGCRCSLSQVAGLIVTRYLVRLEPMASMPAEVVVATYGPVLQHYLTGDLP